MHFSILGNHIHSYINMIRYITGLLFVLMTTSVLSQAQTIAEKYQLARWLDNKPAVVTYTFDDNDANQLPVALPLFDEYNYKVTFFALTRANWRPIDWEGLKAAVENGHEVGVHTATHPDLTTLTVEQQREEYEFAIEDIKNNIPGYNPLTVAYPYCNIGDSDLVSELFIAGRICSGQVIGGSPSDFNLLSSMVAGSESSIQRDRDFNGRADDAARAKGWTVFLLHGIDDDGGYSPVASRELADHLEYMNENEATFWVATFVDVVKYIKSRDAASVTEVSADENEIVVQVSDSLDREIYDQPVTVMREIPEGWDSVSVSQNGKAVPTGTTEIRTTRYSWFTVMPDSGDIILEPATATSAEAEELPEQLNLIKNYPNPFNPGTTLTYQVREPGEVRISIHDVLGKELEVLVQESQNPGEYSVNWNGSTYSSGTYLYRYESGEYVQTGKMQLVK